MRRQNVHQAHDEALKVVCLILYYTLHSDVEKLFLRSKMKKGGLLSSSILKSKRGKKPPKLQLASSLIYFFCFHKYKKKRPFFCFCQQPYYIELYTSFFLLAILYILEAFLFEWNALLVRQTTDLQFNEFFEVTFSIKRQRNLKISTFTICKHDAFFC